MASQAYFDSYYKSKGRYNSQDPRHASNVNKKPAVSEKAKEAARLQKQQDTRAVRDASKPKDSPVNLDYLKSGSAPVKKKAAPVKQTVLSDTQQYLKGIRDKNPDKGRTLKDKINN